MKSTAERFVVVGTYVINGETTRSAVDEYATRPQAMQRFEQLVADQLYTPYTAHSLKVQSASEYQGGAA
jgi:hypothetical protein